MAEFEALDMIDFEAMGDSFDVLDFEDFATENDINSDQLQEEELLEEEHNYDNDIDFVSKKEKMLNIINHYPIVKNNIEYERPNRLELLYFFENTTEFCLRSESLKKLKNNRS